MEEGEENKKKRSMPSTSKRLVIAASVDFREERKWERGPRSGRRRRQQRSGWWCPFGGLLDVCWSVRAGKCTVCHESVGWKRKRRGKKKIKEARRRRNGDGEMRDGVKYLGDEDVYLASAPGLVEEGVDEVVEVGDEAEDGRRTA